LLRREFEETPLTAAEAADCRELIFRGLCNDGGAAAAATKPSVFGWSSILLWSRYVGDDGIEEWKKSWVIGLDFLNPV
ncbi:hypothetical protein ACOIC7_30605, partial [Klebsiella pneumoniae]|uniref:hypothetical protein n=1 Tax=Klebsiella pneumoniae TaxID=573 RepID=UPI003B5BB942